MAREGGQKSSFMTSLLHNSGGRAYRIVHVPSGSVELQNNGTNENWKEGAGKATVPSRSGPRACSRMPGSSIHRDYVTP
jgi:hypothetical protein